MTYDVSLLQLSDVVGMYDGCFVPKSDEWLFRPSLCLTLDFLRVTASNMHLEFPIRLLNLSFAILLQT